MRRCPLPDTHPARVAVVTGASAGIGQAYARRLAQDGLRVIVADIADAGETVALVRQAGSDGFGVRCDVSLADDVAGLAAAATERFGGVDVLVHNSGIYPMGRFLDTDWQTWRRVMDVNLDSLFHLGHAFLPGMRERGWGRVVAMASNTFHAGVGGMTAYVASKGGVIGWVRGVAGEVGGDGVTVNAIAPSLVRTPGTSTGVHEELGLFEAVADLQAIKRTQTPDDLVGAMAFLASEEARFITGQTLVVDGGWIRA